MTARGKHAKTRQTAVKYQIMKTAVFSQSAQNKSKPCALQYFRPIYIVAASLLACHFNTLGAAANDAEAVRITEQRERAVIAARNGQLEQAVSELRRLAASSAPDWHRLWRELQTYTRYIAGLTAWLLFWGIARRKTLSASTPQPQPPALTIEEQASTLKLNAQDLRAWQCGRNQIVHFDENGNITNVTAGPMG